MDNVLPNVLRTNAVDENQSTMVESIIHDAESHVWYSENYGKTRFLLQKKGDVLASNGTLIWKVNWSAEDVANDRSATVPRLGGALSMVENCRMYYGGKLVSELRNAGRRIAIDEIFTPLDHQVEVADVKLGSNHQYFYKADGSLQLAPDIAMNTAGTREVRNGTDANLEVCVPLKELVPMFKDILLPTALQGDIVLEIDWNARWSDCIVEGGTGGVPAGENRFSVDRPRLHLDYITFNNEVSEALRDEINGDTGKTELYRQAVLVNSQLPAIANGETTTTDVELGFSNRSVMKLYIQKNVSASNPLLRNLACDGLLQEEYQLVVNNKLTFDRNVNVVPEMYSYLNQTGDAQANIIAGTYDQVGVATAGNVALNAFSDSVLLPSNAGTATTGVRDALQGKQRWVGINLAKTRTGQDTPQNAVQVGQNNMVLRYTRSATNLGNGESNSAYSKSVVQLNVWVECVKAVVMRNGKMEVVDM
jgi:hypothetical protein